MEALLESAVRSTLIGAVFGLVLTTLRISSPTIRHRWWSALIVIMLALPVLAIWGPELPVQVIPSGAVAAASAALVETPLLLDAGDIDPLGESQVGNEPSLTWVRSLTLVYLAGLVWLVGRLLMGTWHVHALSRQATVIDGHLTNAHQVTPAAIGFIRPRIILPGGWQRWPPEVLRAILAHEAEHVRRRDAVFLWLALANRALFWFHPLAWWLRRHLARLAEEACDAAVVARGTDRTTYCEALLECARAAALSGGRVRGITMPMPGSGLPRRIQQILSPVQVGSASRVRLVCAVLLSVGGATMFAAAAPTVVQSESLPSPRLRTAVPADQRRAPGPDSSRDQSPAVVSVVKPNRDGAMRSVLAVPLNGTFRATSVTLMDLIGAAYGGYLPLDPAHMSGLPGWAKTERFDVEAKQEVSEPTEDRVDDEAIHAAFSIVRSVLAERFGLRAHDESRREAVYVLVTSGTVKMRPTSRDCEAILKAGPFAGPPAGVAPESWAPCGTRHRPGELVAIGGTMEQLAQRLAEGGVGRPVVNRTGLNGYYDYTLQWMPFQGTAPERGGNDDAPSIFAALPEQLGLKLQSDRAPVRVLVIDRVTRPTPN